MQPKQRTSQIVVETMDHETVILDHKRNKAHCLNAMAAAVWRRCDGNTTVAQIAAGVRKEIGSAIGEDDVVAALEKLRKVHLLEPEAVASEELVRRGRRAMGRKLAAAGLAALVTTITVPTAAMAASGLPPGACCQPTDHCAVGNCVGGGACPPGVFCPGGKCCT